MKLGRQKDSMNGEPFRFTIFDAVHQPLMSTMKLSFKLWKAKENWSITENFPRYGASRWRFYG